MKNHQEIQACDCRKHCYRSHSDARRKLRQLATMRRTEERAYRCPICGHWHLTSQPYDPKGGGAQLNVPREGVTTPESLMRRPAVL